jgi:SAM-dependent methyltransferase
MKTNFETLVYEAEQAHFSGWDFSYLKDRLVEEEPPWNYRQMVLDRLPGAQSLLDMGTGGGEFLAGLPGLPAITCATEAWEPNLAVARRRLEPLGVRVEFLSNEEQLPFDNQSFGLVINRHESVVPAELYRVLQPGGIFITQQVGGKDNLQLNDFLDPQIHYPYADWDMACMAGQLEAAGFTLLEQWESFPAYRFLDIGAVVYYLKVIEWQIPGFNTQTYRERLLALHEKIQTEGAFITTSHRFFIIARKIL